MDFFSKSVEFHGVDAEPALSSKAEKEAEIAGHMHRRFHMKLSAYRPNPHADSRPEANNPNPEPAPPPAALRAVLMRFAKLEARRLCAY